MLRPVLIRLPISHYCRKVEWAFSHLGMDYDASDVWFRDLVDFRDVNPENTVPVLDTEDGLVCGSAAILHWASEHHEAGHTLYPTPEVDAWEAWADATLGPLARRDAYRTIYEHPTRYTRNPLLWALWRANRRLVLGVMKLYKARRFYDEDDAGRDAVLSRIGERLRTAGTGYLFGPTPCAADFATAALLEPMLRVHRMPQCDHPDWHRLKAYVRRVKPRRTTRRSRSRMTAADRARWVEKGKKGRVTV